jgi:hypothetical protein
MKADQHHALQSSASSLVLGAWCWPLMPVVPPDALRASGGIAAFTSFVALCLGAKRASEQGTSPDGSAVKPAARRPLRR